MAELGIPGDITLHYTDTEGDGRPVVLIHGWPLSGAAWKNQLGALSGAGCRVIAYDRRGFGASSKPAEGYEYDTLASDLNELILALDLTDAVLVGFSMGGGEVARYLGTYGSDRVAGAVFAAAVTPALAVTDDNPDGGMPQQGFDDLADQFAADPSGFLEGFVTTFFSTPTGLKVSGDDVAEGLALAQQADAAAAEACIRIWGTDFRRDLAGVTVPTLVLHGEGDQNVPFAVSAARMPGIVTQAELVALPDAPHGINVSHAAEFNAALVDFIGTLG